VSADTIAVTGDLEHTIAVSADTIAVTGRSKILHDKELELAHPYDEPDTLSVTEGLDRTYIRSPDTLSVTRSSKILNHFKRHKWKYITGALCIGSFIIGYCMNKPQVITNVITQTTDDGVNFIGDKNIVLNLVRRGHPGFVVKCKETGEVFASIRRCASVMGVSTSNIRNQINGKITDVSGYTFEILGECK